MYIFGGFPGFLVLDAARPHKQMGQGAMFRMTLLLLRAFGLCLIQRDMLFTNSTKMQWGIEHD